MLCIASWNVNSIRKRMHQVERLVDDTQADIICLQETKCSEAMFPAAALAGLGYPHQAYAGQAGAGQSGYNGVAILSKLPLSDVARHHHCGRADARHIAARVDFGGAPLTVHSLYVPAGGQIPDVELNPKFAHKLKFVDAVGDHFAACHGLRDLAVVAGDFNIAPLPADVWDHRKMSRIVTHTPIEVEALERMKRSLYFIDALREVVAADDPVFTWWSYRAADWQAANKGRRLDHIWVTPALKSHIAAVEILTDVRHWQPPSDHVPVVLKLRALETPAGTHHHF
ncbi:MAG: exodeoxyribonuclease III [Rhodospirillaceae bacterium]|nr:exodeoxyribonuclease III [Rhodospirillaceae bacterium]